MWKCQSVSAAVQLLDAACSYAAPPTWKGFEESLLPLILCAQRQSLLCVSLKRTLQLKTLLACRCGSCGGSDDVPCNGGHADLGPNGPGQELLLASESHYSVACRCGSGIGFDLGPCNSGHADLAPGGPDQALFPAGRAGQPYGSAGRQWRSLQFCGPEAGAGWQGGAPAAGARQFCKGEPHGVPKG